jgi:uncharacterized membrane protein
MANAIHPEKLISARIQSIDLLRGIVMIIMALDHVRDYFHADAFLFNPLDLQKTSVTLFATRWITHVCAPVFVFLAGTSAFLVGSRKGKRELSSFLVKRGLWLLVLEFTVINFAWFFNINFELMALTVIWALGVSMIVLGAAIHLPFKVLLALGVVFVFGHNLLDTIHIKSVWWSLLHEQSVFHLGHFIVYVGYPLLPWIGTMFLGYCFGSLYLSSVKPEQRKKLLLQLGVAATLLFIVLRVTDIYGEPYKWETQASGAFTFLSFMNVTKYPPSLLYLLATLGPSLIFLALAENLKGKISQYVISLGRVPMFFYIIHIAFVHIIALFAAKATGFDFSDMVFNTWVTDSPNLRGYGFSLGVTYLVWIGVILALMPLCIWYDGYKIRNREKWWLSYL